MDEEEEGKARPAEIGWKTASQLTRSTRIRTPQSRPLQTMVRQFKHHEQKLLKKVDFLNVRPSLSTESRCSGTFSGSKMPTFAR